MPARTLGSRGRIEQSQLSPAPLLPYFVSFVLFINLTLMAYDSISIDALNLFLNKFSFLVLVVNGLSDSDQSS